MLYKDVIYFQTRLFEKLFQMKRCERTSFLKIVIFDLVLILHAFTEFDIRV